MVHYCDLAKFINLVKFEIVLTLLDCVLSKVFPRAAMYDVITSPNLAQNWTPPLKLVMGKDKENTFDQLIFFFHLLKLHPLY